MSIQSAPRDCAHVVRLLSISFRTTTSTTAIASNSAPDSAMFHLYKSSARRRFPPVASIYVLSRSGDNRCTIFTGPFDISGMFRNISLEDPGKPLREHAAGVTSFCRKSVDNFRVEFVIESPSFSNRQCVTKRWGRINDWWNYRSCCLSSERTCTLISRRTPMPSEVWPICDPVRKRRSSARSD